jgi:hypothetical protein
MKAKTILIFTTTNLQQTEFVHKNLSNQFGEKAKLSITMKKMPLKPDPARFKAPSKEELKQQKDLYELHTGELKDAELIRGLCFWSGIYFWQSQVISLSPATIDR